MPIAAMSTMRDIAVMGTYGAPVTESRLNARSLPNLGAAVRALRLRRGLTQVELASRAGVSRRWLMNLEAGRTFGVETGRVMTVLDALDASLWVVDDLASA